MSLIIIWPFIVNTDEEGVILYEDDLKAEF
jgi:hypothetical protein